MGVKQSKRSVDISSTPQKPGVEVNGTAVEAEKIENGDTAKEIKAEVVQNGEATENGVATNGDAKKDTEEEAKTEAEEEKKDGEEEADTTVGKFICFCFN